MWKTNWFKRFPQSISGEASFFRKANICTRNLGRLTFFYIGVIVYPFSTMTRWSDSILLPQTKGQFILTLFLFLFSLPFCSNWHFVSKTSSCHANNLTIQKLMNNQSAWNTKSLAIRIQDKLGFNKLKHRTPR